MPSYDFTIATLGPAAIPSPVQLSRTHGDLMANYVGDEERILYDARVQPGQSMRFDASQLLELAGPRERVYFDGAKVHAGIVTAGGLCPGLNDVIRSVVMNLWHDYGVRRISGFRYGYRGLSAAGLPPLALDPEVVDDIHLEGGSILGSSRGGTEDISQVADHIDRIGLHILFTVGGDGTLKGSLAIAAELERKGRTVALVGIPKTIDNDISFLERSFGFETAVAHAVQAVDAAHVEAHGAPGGIGLVKLMGRDSGFIAAHTALASGDVNFVLIPEVPFALEGENGLLAHLKRRLAARGHAVIVVAEGAGQNLLPDTGAVDAGGNKVLADVGPWLADRIKRFLREQKAEANVKYIDPSYMVRSARANAGDSVYCGRLGANAVHAAMAGKTKMLIGLVNNNLVHIPTALATAQRKTVDPESALWRDVVGATGQPALMTGN
jgi:6-phosphofructokinase 1